MKRSGLVACWLAYVSLAGAQPAGPVLYRGNCAPCHGFDGRGSSGPDLTTAQLRHGDSDESFQRIIRQGIPGTAMPASNLKDEEVRAIVALVRRLRSPVSVPGDRQRGAQLYAQLGCAQCHMVGGRGGRLGPDLSRLAPRPDAVALSIRQPSDALPRESYRAWGGGAVGRYGTVTVTGKDGKKVTGVRLNEDVFTIQIMDREETLHLFTKDEVANIADEPQSLMPPFGKDRIDDSAMRDLIAFLLSRKKD